MKQLTLVQVLVLIFGALTFVPSVNAAMILIDATTCNGSFEQPVVPNGGLDWVEGIGAPWNRTSSPYATQQAVSPPDGNQIALIGYGGVDFWQDVPHTWLPNTIYTLSAYGRADKNLILQSLIMHLQGIRSDGTSVDEASIITNTDTNWHTFSAININTNLPQFNGLVGTSFMRVRFEATNMLDPLTGQLWADNVVLSYTPVPEPSTLTLLGIGAISLLAYTWRRWK